MGTLKKSVVKKKAEDGYKARQGNYPKEETKSSAGEGPSKDYKERQGQASETKSAPNKFPEAKAPEKKQSFGEAFKAGRSSGAKTFTWNGKSYTTETKEDKAWGKAAENIKAKTSAIDKKTTEQRSLTTSVKASPAKSSENAIKAALGQPPKKGLGFTPAKINQNTTFKKPVTKTPVNTSSKARTGLPAMKCGGKTKKK